MKKVLQAKAQTVTESGEFVAIAAAYSVDRAKERIIPGAFKTTIEHWQGSGKQIPLHWDHSGDPHDIIGTVDPASVKETDEGLEVKGQLDLEDSEQAREAWRLVKKNAMGLSFGYLVIDSAKGKDDVVELKALDVFEISITPAPANADTRVLSWKSLAPGEVAERARGMADQIASGDFDKQVTAERLRGFAARVVTMEKAEEQAEERRLKLESQRVEQERQAAKLAEIPEEEPLEPEDFPLPADEVEGAKSGDLKAVWTTAYVNDLPDSAFLYVESGDKDEQGKTTPRSLRHFPYKDASGAVDLPHLRNALARIPQSNLPQSVKDRLTSKAQSILDNAKSVPATEPAVEDAPDEPESGKSQAQDPLKQASRAIALEVLSDGASLHKHEEAEPDPLPVPPTEDDQRRRLIEDLYLP